MNAWGFPTVGCCLLCAALLLPACDGTTSAKREEIQDLDVVEVYDPVTNVWSSSTSMPTPRSMASACGIGDSLYAIGGAQFKAPRVTAIPLHVVEIYNHAEDVWTTGTSMPTRRWSTADGVINGMIHIAGGAYSWRISYDILEVYDPTSGTWSTGTPMITARSRAASGVIDDRLYVVGGLRWSDEEEEYQFLQILEAYDPVAQTWLSLASMPTGREYPAAGVIDGKLYVAGGAVGWLASSIETTDVLEVYDPALSSWTGASSMPTPRSGAVAGVIAGKLYVAGGVDDASTALSVLEVYDPASDSWTSGSPMPTPRAEATACVIDGKLYVLGGY
jgi:N-acetylneuraminic acid mutarotase